MLRITFMTGIAVLLSILMLSGCSPNPQAAAISKLSGDWGITAADRLMQKLGEGSEARSADADAADDGPQMVLQFDSNGTLKTMTKMGRFNAPPKQGTWKLLRWDEPSQSMNIECSIAGQTTEHKVHFLEADLIELVPPNLAGTNSLLRFQRIK